MKILDSDKHSNLSARSVSDEEKIFVKSTQGRLEQSRRSRRIVGQHGRGKPGPPERQPADGTPPGNIYT